MNKSNVDSKQAIEDSIRSIESFRKLLLDRVKLKQQLEEEGQSVCFRDWIVLGRFHLDQHAQLGKYIGLRPIDLDEDLAPVLELTEWKKVHPKWTVNWAVTDVASALPQSLTRCSICCRGWSIDNIDDIIKRPNPRGAWYHNDCWTLSVSVREYNKFKRIFNEAGYTPVFLTPTKDNYWHNHGKIPEPWFQVLTGHGTFLVGQCKIEHNTTIYISFPTEMPEAMFKEEMTVEPETYVHARTCAKAVEYLSRIRSHLTTISYNQK